MKDIMLSLNEIGILPSSYPTDISSRSQVNPYIDGKLPIFVSPMTSVLDVDNFHIFKDSKVTPILPRMISFTSRMAYAAESWTSFSLQEFESMVKNHYPKSTCNPKYVLVDIANGHIQKMYDLVKGFKAKYPECLIMVGNIAHPKMFVECCNAGVDFVRVGIGGGSVCSTSVQCGVHASHVWMIEQIKKYPEYQMEGRTKLIADGGINTLDKAIKCLAIGYDYVMMGKQFAQCEEACGETITTYNEPYYNALKKRKYYGMASEQGQIDISGGCNKNPEGIETWVDVNTNLEQFTSKFEAALRSTMSYVGAHDLDEFKQSEYVPMSIEEFKSYYK